MKQELYTVIDICPLGSNVSLVVFVAPATGERDVQLLPLPVKALTPECLRNLLAMPEPPGEHAETVSIQLADDLNQSIQTRCEAWKITFEQLMQAFLRFCADGRYTQVVTPWLKELVREYKAPCFVAQAASVLSPAQLERLPTVSREELQQDLDAVLRRLKSGETPILVLDNGQPALLLSSPSHHPDQDSPQNWDVEEKGDHPSTMA